MTKNLISEVRSLNVNNYTFEMVRNLQIPRSESNPKRRLVLEINSRLQKTEKTYYALLKIFKPKLFSKRTKIKLHTTKQW